MSPRPAAPQNFASPQAAAILQPQKVPLAASQQQQDGQGRQSKMFDKEFILELEKNLGLREATANLMPPSPAPSGTAHTRPALGPEPATNGSIPALRPPPQSSLRNSGRRNTTSVTSSALAEASSMYAQQQQQQRRDSSLPRSSQAVNNSSPLQVGTDAAFFV
jgi:hypothetical protein